MSFKDIVIEKLSLASLDHSTVEDASAAIIRAHEEALAAAKQRIEGFGALLESKAVEHERLSRTVEQLAAEACKWKILYEAAQRMILNPVEVQCEGWRLLSPGEVVQADDECWDDEGHDWSPIGGLLIGEKFNLNVHEPVRRRMSSASKEGEGV